MTAPAHVIVFRPIIQRLRERGHEVEVTARDYSQTLELLEMHGIEHVAFGQHGGASRAEKAMALARRTASMRRFGSKRSFDLALAHGSNDLALAAAMLRIPAANTFDYEFAVVQHNIGCRLAHRVAVPDRIPAERLKRYGVGPGKLVQYPGPEGGVLPGRLRAGPGRARRPGRGPRAHRRGLPAAARRRALSPHGQPALPARARSAGTRRGRPRRRDPSHRRAARVRARASACRR